VLSGGGEAQLAGGVREALTRHE